MIGGATVGVAEHGNSVELVTVAADGALIDRRRVDLTHDLPTHPYHHEGAWAVGRYLDSPWARPISLPEAIALVERVQALAEAGAARHLSALAEAAPISVIALRRCPDLPPTIEGRIRDNRAQTQADSVMYRRALADAARALGWRIHWYDPDRVMHEAAAAVGADLQAHLRALGAPLGPPWRRQHKLAAAAALVAMGP